MKGEVVGVSVDVVRSVQEKSVPGITHRSLS